MCKVLNISKSTYYYKSKKDNNVDEIETKIKDIFIASKNNYGSRKIKHELKLMGYNVSIRRIRRIMTKLCLVSNYTVKQFKATKNASSSKEGVDLVNQNFSNKERLDIVVSDLTYVRVGNKWHYVCIMLDLFNREIIGYSSGPNKDANLVIKDFTSIKLPLSKINIFHSDNGNEFLNNMVEMLLERFNIQRSLSKKGCPYDNAVSEAGFKIIKKEFINNKIFKNQLELEIELFDYVNWYNNIRIHGSLGYSTPVEYRLNNCPY